MSIGFGHDKCDFDSTLKNNNVRLAVWTAFNAVMAAHHVDHIAGHRHDFKPNHPTWAADGRSLYYRTTGNRFFEAEIVAAGESRRIGQSTLLFDALLSNDFDAPMYDVTPDGERFLVNTMSEEEARIPLTVALNWKSGL